jgi:hypothetical protein
MTLSRKSKNLNTEDTKEHRGIGTSGHRKSPTPLKHRGKGGTGERRAKNQKTKNQKLAASGQELPAVLLVTIAVYPITAFAN